MREYRTAVALAALLGLAAPPPAQADLRMVQVVMTTGHSSVIPGGKMTMTPPPLGAKPGIADDTVRVTLSVRGPKSRADDGAFSTIIDQAARQETFLDRARKTYVRRPWEPTAPYKPQGATLDVHRTGSAARILGHPAHEYVLSGTLYDYPVSGTVWAADDLPQAALPTTLGGQSSAAWVGQVPGLVLKMNLFLGVPNAPATTWHFRMQVAALSTAPLPASAFVVPAGYREGPAGK